MADVDGRTLAPFAWLFGTLGSVLLALLAIAGVLVGVAGHFMAQWPVLAVGVAVALIGCIGMGLLFAFAI